MEKCKNLKVLDLMDNNITPLGETFYFLIK